MEMSPEIGELAKALAAAQAAMPNPTLDAVNPHFRNKFASLAGVRNTVLPVLAAHGISMTQDLTTTDRGVAVRTILTHASGQQMVFGPLEMPATKMDAQGFGSAATYARRYALMAVCGVVGDTDDDAEVAAKPRRVASVSSTIVAGGDPVTVEVDLEKRDKYYSRILDILKNAADMTEEAIAAALLKADETLQKDQHMMQAVFAVMSANERNSYKAYVANARGAQQKTLANGRAA